MNLEKGLGRVGIVAGALAWAYVWATAGLFAALAFGESVIAGVSIIGAGLVLGPAAFIAVRAIVRLLIVARGRISRWS